ncbi:BlaI/MecI/CopY family transcriptional regulator [Phosphitispora fastidiosa]|uniref:BlaI/MecI/CopY family transcriptional regulator n=1 Tax=Phosphitispora fastidiosa TaxID=2837202 RepID=UPI001E347C39|nr:BlaI/MecI/CopY family transcriptional regulator [Phosphitispora fastidiosa]MBU7005721.1 putative transcriptional regulator [Phosphitispora fastidiosa]
MFLSKFISDFKPHKLGLKKVLGDLEAEVMKIMWQKEKATVREVHEHLFLTRELAYTTVMTIMSRLADKKLLNKEPKGNAFVYSPAVSEAQFASMVAGEVLDGLMEDFAEPALSHMVDRLTEGNPGRLDELEKRIKELRTKGDG